MRQFLHARTASAWVLGAGLVVAAVLLAAVLGLLAGERARAVQAQLERNELFARVLEDHVTRSVETSALALDVLAGALAEAPLQAPASEADFVRMLGGLPQVRTLALVDGSGRVLASSNPGEAGLHIEPSRLGQAPAPGKAAIGSYVSGRGLASLAALSPGAAPASPPGVGFIPLVRTATLRGGQPLRLLALLNPDGLATQMRLTLNDGSSRAVISSFDGQVLASSDTVSAAPGTRLARLPVFSDYLPRSEHAAYVGAGIAAQAQVLAFRVSRTQPLVVLVERPQSAVTDAWLESARWRIAAGLGACLLTAALSFSAARSLRARELARRRLDEAQADVARSERELSAIVRSVQELLFRTDASGVLTFVNARWSAASGQGAEWALGRPLSSLVKPDERAAVRALFAANDAQEARSVHVTLWSATGRPRRYDIAVVPLARHGSVLGYAGSGVDVTERREAEERLQEELAFTERLLEISPLPTAMLDGAGRYLSVNRAWEEFTGRARARVIGQAARSFAPPEEAARHEAVDRELLVLGGSRRYEASRMHADGTRRDLMFSKVAVPGRDGRPAGILSVFLDVTEMRGAERATREARDAAEEASRAKSEFVANISHELRTPLQSIIGFSELGTVRGRDQPRLAGMFSDIHASGVRMLALVNDLLDVSKIDSAVGTFHLERTDLRPLVREVLRELEPLLAGRQLHVERDISVAPLVAKVDPLRFQQVMRNVLANAIKFSPSGAAIDLQGEVSVDGEIHFSIRDRGPGIPREELETIFEAFVQSSKTKDGSGGTGLGLAICRKIIAAHGGRIAAENMPDAGSRFHIHLPARGFADTQPATELG